MAFILESTLKKLNISVLLYLSKIRPKKKCQKGEDFVHPDLVLLTVCLELARLAAPASSLINGLNNEDVLCATLQPMHCVVVLFDIRNNHPAVG